MVEKPDFVVIASVEQDGRLHLVQQFRYPVGARYWELPQGSWERAPEADPLDIARGELQEETGLIAAEIVYAGHLFQGYGLRYPGLPHLSRHGPQARGSSARSGGAGPHHARVRSGGC